MHINIVHGDELSHCTRLSATTSSATTSSSEGRGRRDDSPDNRRDLHLPDLDRPLPVYDVQYGVRDGSDVEFISDQSNSLVHIFLVRKDANY